MKTDNNPSIIFGLYTTPENKQELFKELKKRGYGFRELTFIDVELKLEKYDEEINFFKH